MTHSTQISIDQPLDNPDDDRLDFARFAENLAKAIQKIAAPQGLVIAINGKWGSGKTTLMEFVLHYLDDKSSSPIVVRFNPWWFSGRENILMMFFRQFEAVLGESTNKYIKRLVVPLRQLTAVVASLPIQGSGVPKLIADLIPDVWDRDIYELKADISKKLKKSKKRILIVIDDIDRLDKEEMQQLFAVIKSVADFPNVIYLLAFDQDIVAKALGDNGNEYLDKIVQMSFSIPFVSREQLMILLKDRLLPIVGDDTEFIPRDFMQRRDGHMSLLFRFIDTPRKVNRLTNAIALSYPIVRDEVYTFDFIMIEALRVSFPETYDLVRNNKNSLTGHEVSESDRELYRSILESGKTDDHLLLDQILKLLFPKFDAKGGFGGAFASSWRRDLRVCSPDLFDVYFRLSIPDTTVSNAGMIRLLSAADNSELFERTLVEVVGESPDRAQFVFQRLSEWSQPSGVNQLPPVEKAVGVVKALLNVGEGYVQRSPNDFWAVLGNATRDLLVGIIISLLRSMDKDKQIDTIREGFKNGNADVLAISVLVAIEQSHGRFGYPYGVSQGQMILNEDNLSELEELGLDKIRSIVKRESFLSSPSMYLILTTWTYLHPEEARDCITELLKEDKELFEFLKVMGVPYRNLDNIDRYIPIDTLVNRVKSALASAALSESDQEVAESIVKRIENDGDQ